MRTANGTAYWTPFIGTVTTKCMGQERRSSRREVPMTRIDQLRSRVRGQLSSTVLKTNAKSDLDRVEFIENRLTINQKGLPMANTYLIHAWCDRPFITYLDEVEAATPKEAIA